MATIKYLVSCLGHSAGDEEKFDPVTGDAEQWFKYLDAEEEEQVSITEIVSAEFDRIEELDILYGKRMAAEGRETKL